MRIAYLNNHFQLGGAETVVRQLHSGMVLRGHTSKVLVTDYKSLPNDKNLKPLYPRVLSRLEHSRLSKISRKFFPRYKWTDRAVEHLARSNYDIIHVHSFHGIYASIQTFARLVQAKPVIWTFHRFWGVTGGCDHPFGCMRYQYGCGSCPQIGNFAVGAIDRTASEWRLKMDLLRNLPLTIISPSQHLANTVRNSEIGRNWETVVIHNGIDSSEFSMTRKHNPYFRKALGLKEDKICLLFTNRDFRDEIKGWPVIHEALSRLNPANIQLLLVGGGSEWAAKQLSKAWDIVDYGYVRDRRTMASIYEAADVFLYASSGENFPCAILEAMSSGCCIVTTPVDGVLEQIESGRSGFVAEGMDGEALALCLETALRDRKVIELIGRKARESVSERFSEAEMIRKHSELYNRVLEERSST
jgi:glycosyltransferase involved in cell wall biosynthesis